MGDVHLGFKPKNVYEMAKKHFSTVKVEKISESAASAQVDRLGFSQLSYKVAFRYFEQYRTKRMGDWVIST